MMAEEQRSPASFHFSHNPHAGSLLQGLQGLQSNNLLTDVILCVSKKEIPCHRNVLAACSDYFRAMFCNGHRESKEHKVTIHEVSPGALQLLVDYAYTSEVTITEDNAEKLLEGADFFQILPVRDACVTFICNNLSAKDCLQMMQVGNTLSCPDLEKNASLCALKLKEFTAVSKTPEFLSLTKDQLITLISSDDLNASEETVYTAVMTWINHDTRKRMKEMRELMELVRFPFMDKLYFLENVDRNEIVRKSCQDILTEAHRYQLFPGEVQSPRTRPRHISGLREAIVVIGGILEEDPHEKKCTSTITMTYSAEPTQSSWTTMKQSLTTDHFDPVPVAVLGVSDVVMSSDDGDIHVMLYQPELDSWCDLAPMIHIKRTDPKLAVLYGKVYAIGGREYLTPLTSVEVYDRSQHKWTEGVSLPEPRCDPAVAVLDSSIYVMGGYDKILDGLRVTSTVYRFTPGDSQWQSMSDMPKKGGHISASVLNGSIYAITGEPPHILCSFTPGDDGGVWTTVASGIRESCGMTTFGGKIYILGGKEGNKGSSEVVCFDPKNRSLECVGNMARGLFDNACVTILKKYC
ncbi:kelch-like protein 24a [Branchiostoma lanceolatum]|uniref:kelch-like protein 24a n=1 Tax=Branchiostoma lanceolatum TaxID=7740 RepID=UPI003452F420